MNFLLKTTMACCLALGMSAVAMAQTPSRCYGIQIYSPTEPDAEQKLVSFSVDHPGQLKLEKDLSGHTITAATCYDGIYYMLDSDDGVVPSKMLTYDIAHKTLEEVKSFDINNDLLARLVVLDMTFAPGEGLIYAVAADLSQGVVVGGQLNAPFGLYWIDPYSGDADLIGFQETSTIVAIASGEEDLWGIDEHGELWIMSQYTGAPEDILWSFGITPAGTQSMSYDFENDVYYWASYSTDPSTQDGKSELISFRLTEDWEVLPEELGSIGANAELIGLYVESNPVSNLAPEAVSDFSVTPAPNGLNEATLTWTNPTRTFGGSDLSGSLTIVISRDDAEVKRLTGTPGETMSWTDTSVAAAVHTYSITVYSGDMEGATLYASPIYVGTDIPGAPSNVKAERTPQNNELENSHNVITVTWEAPEVGAEGGWYDPTDLHYCVTRFPDNVVVVESTTQLSFQDWDITNQAGYSYGIKVITDNGFGPEAVSNVVVSGNPLNPPYSMTLDSSDERLWTIIDGDGDGHTWYLHSTGWGGTWDPFFYYHPEENLDPAGVTEEWLISPYFSLEVGKKYLIEYDLRLYGTLFPTDDSLWLGTSTSPESMTRQLVSNDDQLIEMVWETQTVPLSVETSGQYTIGFRMDNRVPAQFYKFNLREVSETDLAVLNVTGPATVSIDSEFTYTATVKNAGFNPVSDYTVSLVDAQGVILGSTTVSESLAAGEKKNVEVVWTPNTEGIVEIYAMVQVNGDADVNNDKCASIKVSVLGRGEWVDITDGDTTTGFVPLYTRSHYSAAESLYPEEMINTGEGYQIKALTYYIGFFSGAALDMDLELWVGNTSDIDFNGSPLPESKLTKVFDGAITLSPGQESFTIVFDEPYEYSGESLVIFTRHHSESTASIAFRSLYDKYSQDYSLCYNSDSTPFDFTQAMTPMLDLPNVSLLMDDGSGVEKVVDMESSAIRYDRVTRRLSIEGDFNVCRVFDASGMRIAEFSAGDEMILPAGEGIAIVTVSGSEGQKTKKIRR